MPAAFMTLFPHTLNSLEVMKLPIQANIAFAKTAIASMSLGFDWVESSHNLATKTIRQFLPLITRSQEKELDELFCLCHEGAEGFLAVFRENLMQEWGRFLRKRLGELEFLRLFTDQPPRQEWSVEYDDRNVILDLPSLRVIDVSADIKHQLQNYGVVFAPRAGHHSNIAERVALYMRDQGVTRMAVVEQKCAEDIPLYVGAERHYEGFDGQVDQYRRVLEHLKSMTGRPPHLIAICQPGPLLMSTLILNPGLGKTFGSAGAPMDTEAEKGFLTEFARMAGEDYMDKLIAFFGQPVSEKHLGAGREIFDGRLQVLGFYFLGLDQHFRNFRRLLADLKQGNEEAAERQKTFYQWYNYVHHFPAGFVRDTFKRIFIDNALIRGTLHVCGKTIGIKDYPSSIPIWALGGAKDDIAPPLQATGHMQWIRSVQPENKLTLICEGGHMGLFRSGEILERYYGRIVEFILARSDKSEI